MGLGTASVTLLVAGLSVWAREGSLASLPGAQIARALPMIELAVGAVIAVVALQLLVQRCNGLRSRAAVPSAERLEERHFACGSLPRPVTRGKAEA